MDTIMKKILSIIALSAAFAFTVSCDLSEYNPNAFGPAIAYATAENCQLGINAFYRTFPSATGAYSQEQGSVDYMTAKQMNSRFQVGYGPASESDWGDWDDIRQINYYLTMMNSEACGVTGEVKENFVGQARFFRAYKYFKMLCTYGDLPWYDHVIGPADKADEYKDRDSRDVIIAHIIDDLNYAIEHVTATSNDATTLTKEVAQFVKMRVCLYEASFRKYNNITSSVKGAAFSNYTVNDLYRLAADAAKAIMDEGKYKLVSDYRSLFISGSLQKDEVLLGAATSPTVKGSQNNYFNYRAESPRSLSRAFINTFLMKDGTPYTAKAGYETETFAQEFVNRDPRLAMIVRTPGYHFADAVATPKFDIAPTGYQIIKFCLDDYQYLNTDEKGEANGNATPIFRYAEVLLDYAEAKAELGEMDATIWTRTIGALRQRAGVSDPGLPTTVDPYLKANFYKSVDNPVIMEIRRERACELCLEGQRGSDLLRWGCGETLANLPWTGLNIAGINMPIDLDGNGTYDVYFNEAGKSVPDAYKSIKIDVNDETGIEVKKVGDGYQLQYNIASTLRNWDPDGHLSLAALAKTMIEDYEQHGYTLTQNPGY